MKTGCFFTYAGTGRISIARWAPRGTASGFRTYRALAPRDFFNKVDWATYQELYAQQLAVLDPAQVWFDLHQLARGSEPVLMCWERLENGANCHRRLVAEWFEKSLGRLVPELNQTTDPGFIFSRDA
jgi:hypothetical protein